MNVELLTEPSLEFAESGQHIDPRFGILGYGPLDATEDGRARQIEAGVIGTSETIEGVRTWLEACRDPIKGKQTRLRNLFPDFPGFAGDTMFQSELVFDDQFDRELPIRELRRTLVGKPNDVRRSVTDLVVGEMAIQVERRRPRVILVALPLDAVEKIEPGAVESLPNSVEEDDRPQRAPSTGSPIVDFHDLLKARVMPLRTPIQLVHPPTYDATVKRRQKGRGDRVRQLQDEATRAWNFHTALYLQRRWLPVAAPEARD